MKKSMLALVFGGETEEHAVSVQTAFSIIQHVDYSTYVVHPIYITKNGEWFEHPAVNCPLPSSDLLTHTDRLTPIHDLMGTFRSMDVVFPVIHGPNGEDGTLQGLLELLHVPYVGSGVLSSAIGMDKVMMKKVFAESGIPQCNYLSFTKARFEEDPQLAADKVATYLGFPCFVKPANLGSSVGITKVSEPEELTAAIDFAFTFDRKVIIEEHVEGREIEIGVLGNEDVVLSEIGEIILPGGFYDYASKYESTGSTQLMIPADLPPHVKTRVEKTARYVFEALECSGLSRIDFFYQEETGAILVNEINTMPGFTPHSMYPMLFAAKGIAYPALIQRLIALAIERHPAPVHPSR